MLQGDADALGEAYRIHQVKTVAHWVARHIALVEHSPVHGIRVLLHPPGVAKIVLGARSVQARWPLFAVDEDHIIAFAPPTTLKMCHGEITSDIVAAPFRLQYDVVALGVQVHDVCFGAVDLNAWPPRFAWVFAPPLRVEVDPA